MKKIILSVAMVFCLSIPFFAQAQTATYGVRLCHSDADVRCLVVHQGDTWESLFPDPAERDLIKRLNRMNIHVYPGLFLAVPNQNVSLLSLAPFKQNVGYLGEKQIVVDPKQLAWGAYDKEGNLVNWGPASTGQAYCPDQGGPCRTPIGTFTVYDKKGQGCVSSKFPIGKGGAPMPYCMHFHDGFALHGSYEMPGVNASHGCVRMFPQDAQWLNENFVKVGSTHVIIESYYDS